MIFKNAMSFKAKIKQVAYAKKIATQYVQQHYFLEVFLEKLAKSVYRNNFIIKGGYLIGGIIGIDQRATMDLDTSIQGFELNVDNLTNIVMDILSIKTEESIKLSFESIKKIREIDNYPGYRIKLYADFEQIHELVTIDVTTGDAITPKEVDYKISRILSDGELELLSYPIETILAEKIETILNRSVASTRPRDYYDVFALYKMMENNIDFFVLKEALNNTITNRYSRFEIEDYKEILQFVSKSEFQRELWSRYQKQFDYAQYVSFDEVVNTVEEVLNNVLNVK